MCHTETLVYLEFLRIQSLDLNQQLTDFLNGTVTFNIIDQKKRHLLQKLYTL